MRKKTEKKSPPPLNKELLSYQEMLRRPGIWIEKAELLETRAKVIVSATNPTPAKLIEEKYPDVTSAFLAVADDWSIGVMLYAFAIENRLKAIILDSPEQSENLKVNSNRFISNFPWKTSKGHDLVYLAKLGGVELTEEKKEMLLQLKDHIERGRYPLPINFNMKVIKSYGVVHIERLIDEIKSEYRRKLDLNWVK